MTIYPEFKIAPEHVKAWMSDRQGAIVGVDLMRRFNWKVGDSIPIVGTIWQPKQGQVWDFNIAGTYDGEAGVDKTQFLPLISDENRALTACRLHIVKTRTRQHQPWVRPR
jgi:hypothetical protein